MTKSTIRVAIDVGSKSHWVGVGLSEGQVLERFSIAHNQKGFEHFFALLHNSGRVTDRSQSCLNAIEFALTQACPGLTYDSVPHI